MKTGKNKVVAALTGSIATGKTVVLDYFRDNLGFKVVSADAVGHEVLKDPEIIRKIGDTFGKNVIKDGSIDRAALGKIVFSDKAELLKLNGITHPAILAKTFEIIDEFKNHWAPEKQRFERIYLLEILSDMSNNHFEPHGQGSHTIDSEYNVNKDQLNLQLK